MPVESISLADFRKAMKEGRVIAVKEVKVGEDIAALSIGYTIDVITGKVVVDEQNCHVVIDTDKIKVISVVDHLCQRMVETMKAVCNRNFPIN